MSATTETRSTKTKAKPKRSLRAAGTTSPPSKQDPSQWSAARRRVEEQIPAHARADADLYFIYAMMAVEGITMHEAKRRLVLTKEARQQEKEEDIAAMEEIRAEIGHLMTGEN